MHSVILLDSTTTELNVTGPKQKGAGFSNTIGCNHTVSISVANFIGRVYIEGSLASDPQEIDWFPIVLADNTDYIQFPRNPMRPTGSGGGDTSVLAFSFSGNYIWIRARVNRDYLIPYPMTTQLVGAVQQILLNYGSVAPSAPNPIVSTGGGPGTQGPAGIQGPTGPTGSQGIPGFASSTGATGPTGPINGTNLSYAIIFGGF